jgi:tight adherence protein B
MSFVDEWRVVSGLFASFTTHHSPPAGESVVGLALLVFVMVSLGIIVGHQLLSGLLYPDSARVRQRIADEFGQDRNLPAASPLYKNPDQLNLELEATRNGDPEAARQALPERGFHARLTTLLEQANLSWTPNQLFVMSAVPSLALGVAGTLFLGPLVGLPGAGLSAIAPLLLVLSKRNSRREKYLKQLPNAFELMARVIRAAQSVPQSLQAVADAFEDPLAGEFKQCLQQQNLGLRPEVTFQQMAERSGILEMRIFAMAMLIQRQTGGNLSEVLDRLAGLVRARLKLKLQVRTLTAEGRLQGWTLVVLPFLVFGVMMVINREYAEVLFNHVPLIAATLASMGLGILWIRKIVDIES